MAKVPVIDIRPCDLDIVREILRRHVPNHEVLAFGSRVKWTARQYSDLDLAIRSDEAIPTDIIYAIKNELSESRLPMMVDVLDMASVSEKFRGIIEAEYAVVQEKNAGVDWEEVRLADVADISTGKSNRVDATEDGEYAFFDRSKEVRKSSRYLFDCEAVIVPGEGKEFIPRYFSGKFDLHQRAYAITNFRGVCGRFVYYAMGAQRKYFERVAVGSTVKSLRLKMFHDFPLKLPPLAEQKKIAHILGALDDKIELNRRMNRTLEAMAQAIFKSWFVDFDPVRAKAKRRPTGLPPEIAELFPAQFQDSELGKIPRGWEVTTLGDVAEITKGRSYKSVELEPSDTALVTLKSFQRGGGYRPDGLKSYIGEYKPEQVVKSGDLIISYTDVTQAGEVIGMPAIILPTGEFSTLVASLDVGIVRPKVEHLPTSYLYHAFLTENFRSHIYAYSTGTTVLHLSVKGVPEYKLAIPPKELCLRYKSLCESLRHDESLNHENSSALAAMRDALIPGMLSGKIPHSQHQQRQSNGF